MSKTNEARAERGRRLLEYHQITLLEEEFDEDIDKCGVASLLADIRHLCAEERIDFDAAVTLSEIHYNEELNGCDDYLDEQT